MVAVLFVLRLVHVACGVLWMGSALGVQWVVWPAQKKLDAAALKIWSDAFTIRYSKIIAPIAGVTILLGIIIGVIGFFRGAPSPPYVVTWLLSLVVGAVIAFNGARNVGPQSVRLAELGPGANEPVYAKLESFRTIDTVGFGVLITCMIAMHFGY